MMQAILHAHKEGFSVSSEAFIFGQLSLFADEQLEALAESHIRLFAAHCRVWLFVDTQAGARANVTAYSRIETARSYDLNVYEYIRYVLTRMLELDHYNHPERLKELLP